jgi:hypothetical protein
MMMHRIKFFWLALGCITLALSGCQTNSKDQLMATSKSQVNLRNMQSRVFDTADKEKTLRTVIAVLQDLAFVIDKADATLGSVSATKLNKYQLRMTVSVRKRNSKQLIVRANAQYQIQAVEEPGPYQQFFASLSKGMFLEAHQIDAAVPVAQ